MFTHANSDYFKYSATIMIPFMYFVQKKLEYIVTSENDFKDLYTFFCPFYKKNIQSLIDEYSTLNKLSLFVDKLVQESNQYMPVTINLYRRNIILLKLANNAEFEEHVLQIRKRIDSFPDIDKQNFENTYEYLKTL